MSLRTPLGRVVGLGSAKDGVHHWWWQRLTAVALVPLTLWFVFSLVSLAGADHAAVVAWMRSPVVAALLIVFVSVTLFHAQSGLQVVIEDYVHIEWVKMAGLIGVKFAAVVLAAIGIVAVLQVALGG